MLKELIGKKVGMTQIFDETGIAIPVTLVEAGPGYVTQVRNAERDGYSSVQLGFGEAKPKRLSGGQLGHLKRNNLSPLRFLREFRVKDPDVKEGDPVTVTAFEIGERVDVIGTSKGKGYQGGIRRHAVAERELLPGPIGRQDPPRAVQDGDVRGHGVEDGPGELVRNRARNRCGRPPAPA